jgi:predicted MPP superfamily phosphohydrolase
MSWNAAAPVVESTVNPEPTKILTWLHLSDLHACKPKTGWDARRATDALCKDLKEMQRKHGLRPDLIFFTGDAAYGHLGNGDGKSIDFRDLIAQLCLTYLVFSSTAFLYLSIF